MAEVVDARVIDRERQRTARERRPGERRTERHHHARSQPDQAYAHGRKRTPNAGRSSVPSPAASVGDAGGAIKGRCDGQVGPPGAWGRLCTGEAPVTTTSPAALDYAIGRGHRESSAWVAAPGSPTVEGGELSASRSRLTVALNVGPQLGDQG